MSTSNETPPTSNPDQATGMPPVPANLPENPTDLVIETTVPSMAAMGEPPVPPTPVETPEIINEINGPADVTVATDKVSDEAPAVPAILNTEGSTPNSVEPQIGEPMQIFSSTVPLEKEPVIELPKTPSTTTAESTTTTTSLAPEFNAEVKANKDMPADKAEGFDPITGISLAAVTVLGGAVHAIRKIGRKKK